MYSTWVGENQPLQWQLRLDSWPEERGEAFPLSESLGAIQELMTLPYAIGCLIGSRGTEGTVAHRSGHWVGPSLALPVGSKHGLKPFQTRGGIVSAHGRRTAWKSQTQPIHEHAEIVMRDVAKYDKSACPLSPLRLRGTWGPLVM